MSYTVTNLITDAYYDSGVVSRQFETIQGYQLNDGLAWFNQLLGDKAMNSGEVPYITVQYPLTLIPGQEGYFIPGLVSIDAITFYINSVRYQMRYLDRIKYFGSPRANNINAIPTTYTWERQTGGVMLYVYFLPQQNYTLTITGNFFLSNVDLNQDLQTQTCTANLGMAQQVVFPLAGAPPVVTNTNPLLFTLAPGQFVINGYDMAGTYASITAMQLSINTWHSTVPATPQVPNVINSPVQPYLTASFQGNDFVLTNFGTKTFGSAAYILVQTNGQVANLSSATFENFPTYWFTPFQKLFLSVNLDTFYLNFLEYALAERICQKLNFEVPIGVATQLARYEAQIRNMAEPNDVTVQKIQCMGDIRGLNYAAANIGRGWTVTGV